MICADSGAPIPKTPKALHVALVLLRVNLWRFLPPDLAQPLAQDSDNLLLDTLRRLLSFPLDSPAVLSVLRLPLAEGGLGILRQTLEAQMHFCLLPRPCSLSP